jgi:RNase P/RNase MRP subunit POP5
VQRPKRRDRYIAFEFADPRLARDIAASFHETVASWPREDRPQLLFIEGRRGLVRCEHLVKDDVVRALNGLRVGDAAGLVRTVGASGTIRRARLRYFPHR